MVVSEVSWHQTRRSGIMMAGEKLDVLDAGEESRRMQRQAYQKPPVEEVVCVIEFAREGAWDTTTPGRIHERLRNSYVESRPLLPVKRTVEVEPLPGGGFSIPMLPPMDPTRQQLVSADEKKILNLGPFSMSVHMIRPYEGWQSFLGMVEQAAIAYWYATQPENPEGAKRLERIGLRFVNQIFLGPNVRIGDLATYFTCPPTPPATDPPGEAVSFYERQVISYPDYPMFLTSTIADLGCTDDKFICVLFDLDISLNILEARSERHSLLVKLGMLKSRLQHVFESRLTNATRDLFNAG